MFLIAEISIFWWGCVLWGLNFVIVTSRNWKYCKNPLCHRSQMWHGEVSGFGCQRQQQVMETTGSCWNSTGLGSTGKVERPSQNLHFTICESKPKLKHLTKKQQPWIVKPKSWNVSGWISPAFSTRNKWQKPSKGDRTPPTNPGENSANNARLQDAARRSELGHAQLTKRCCTTAGLVGTIRIHQPCPVRGSSSAGCCSPECGWVEKEVESRSWLEAFAVNNDCIWSAINVI